MKSENEIRQAEEEYAATIRLLGALTDAGAPACDKVVPAGDRVTLVVCYRPLLEWLESVIAGADESQAVREAIGRLEWDKHVEAAEAEAKAERRRRLEEEEQAGEGSV